MSISKEQIDRWFDILQLNDNQIDHMCHISIAGKALVTAIVEHTEPSADQSAAIRKVREAVWTANEMLKTDE